MNDRATPDAQTSDYGALEKREVLARFFSIEFPEPEYTQTPTPPEFTRDDHGLEIFRDGKKMYTVSISSAMLADRHPTPEELKELLRTREIAKQITQAETFMIDHAALGTDGPVG